MNGSTVEPTGGQLFRHGDVYMTSGIGLRTKEIPEYALELHELLMRHLTGDWGDLCEDDKELNDLAVQQEKEGVRFPDRIMSSYESSMGTVWVITESDRSCTTMLTPEEY